VWVHLCQSPTSQFGSGKWSLATPSWLNPALGCSYRLMGHPSLAIQQPSLGFQRQQEDQSQDTSIFQISSPVTSASIMWPDPRCEEADSLFMGGEGEWTFRNLPQTSGQCKWEKRKSHSSPFLPLSVHFHSLSWSVSCVFSA
jgi:hypothetical protein